VPVQTEQENVAARYDLHTLLLVMLLFLCEKEQFLNILYFLIKMLFLFDKFENNILRKYFRKCSG